jgi:O-acetyl-ADP-ribose deacetylase (regulator of RNase III)/uncharacterized protein YwgA
MSSSDSSSVRLVKGDLLKSGAHALVNTVNCVGVMGKGVALQFKRAYPSMFDDYARRCGRKEVQLGHPYVFDAGRHLIVNFPTKGHWRAVSKLADIEAGLDALVGLAEEWKIRSMAVPPLGCGNGQLDWEVVGPTLVRGLSKLNIPVELYVPHELTVEDAQTELFSATVAEPTSPGTRVAMPALALVEILYRVGKRKHSWPVGRIKFQKLAYFATVAGIPTGLEFEAASFGPYAADLKRTIGRLQNNGLVREERVGRMFETKVGSAYDDVRREIEPSLDAWHAAIDRVTSLMSRLDTTQCEIAATVHFAATRLALKSEGPRPAASDVIIAVEKWKVRRDPPLSHSDIAQAVVNLATLGWIDVEADESVEGFFDEFALV